MNYEYTDMHQTSGKGNMHLSWLGVWQIAHNRNPDGIRLPLMSHMSLLAEVHVSNGATFAY